MSSPFGLRPPTPMQLQALLDAQAQQPLSYPDVGATQGELPAGYHTVDRSIDLGAGAEAFARAQAGIRDWAPQHHAGIRLLPVTPPLTEGQSLVLVFRQFPFHVSAACRVVYLVDEADRFGFGYGTLPHHPEQGEEAFMVERDANGNVRFRIRAFSRPAHLLTKLGSPVSRAVQARVTTRYLEGLQQAVSG
ncbi:MAG TPA: DUF1990 domain-containing protein [Actinomycetota bacterium]|nr:DUF1990 domain-containing protein [Actinomycetota bacterium]